jgi:hypothetical protein
MLVLKGVYIYLRVLLYYNLLIVQTFSVQAQWCKSAKGCLRHKMDVRSRDTPLDGK